MSKNNIQHTCTCHAAILTEQLNDFFSSYAFRYPKYENKNNCDECPYKLINCNVESLSLDQRDALIKLYDDYCITPQNLIGDNISDEDKIKLISEYLDENRTLFHREEERIIYTEAFRRLQYKTQVMVNSASDDQRTRLLHSLDVQKIARKIAIALKANYELAETIAIAHDIGHAPFGHAGEKALNMYLESHLVGCFSHALQGVKVLDFLCSHRALKPKGMKGLGISDLVLEGVLKHDSDSFTDNVSSAKYRLQYDCPNLYNPVKVKTDSLYDGKKVYIGGIESQIVCWADKIAYLAHDWEEFVAVDLLDVMLSRINKIIIQLDEFVRNKTDKKYEYLSDKEKDLLLNLNEKYVMLKSCLSDELYLSDNFSLNDPFVMNLKELIRVCREIVESQQYYSQDFLFFSSEEYKTLFDFFNVARCWMIITKKKPKIIGGKMDIVFIIYKYLNDTTSHRTVPALIECLIESCKNDLLTTPLERSDLIKRCNENWINKCVELNKREATQKEKKIELRNVFAVCFNKEYSDAIDFINYFIFQEFISSTRIRYMTRKAEMIVAKLMDFYYENYQMLPMKQRKRIEFESNQNGFVEKITDLLCEYYEDKISESVMLDKSNAFEAPLYFSAIRENVISKIKFITSNNHSLSTKAPPKTVKRVISDLIKTNPEFAKDAIKLRVIADYVSGMTDRMAEMKYNEICSTGTQWSKTYSERGVFNL